ncbi:MAG: C39 family peptidase [Candidatus Omnitrophota bacterium]
MLFKFKTTSLILLFLTVSGCATVKYPALRDTPVIEVQDIKHLDVKFVRQKRQWCGPAALSSVLDYWGRKVTQDEIARDLYLATIKGVLNFEMERYAAGQGLWTETFSGTWQDIKTKINSGIPVIVLVAGKLPMLLRSHYLVVTGFSESKNIVIAHDGVTKDAIIDKDTFLEIWKKIDNWMLVIAAYELVDWELSKEDYLKLGIVSEKEYKLECALSAYEQALRLAPENYIIYFNIGNVCYKLEDYPKAKLFYSRAKELNPEFSDTYNNLACVYVQTKEFDLAKLNVTKAMAINTASERKVYYLDTLGLIYLNQDKVRDAVIAFEQAETLITPDIPKEIAIQVYRHLLQAYVRAGMGEKAGRVLDKIEGLK